MKFRILTIYLICLILITVFSPLPAAAEEFSIDAKSYVLMDMDTGEILLSVNENLKLAPASTTKIMTGILAIENGNIDDLYHASSKAVFDIGDGGMMIGISPDELMTGYDLLQAMLISSANEAANILAENTSDTISAFVDEMNEKSKELGLADTNFTGVIGLYDADHYTTASDLGYMAKYAMENEVFAEIVAKSSYTLSKTNYHKKWDPLWVSNKLFLLSSNFYDKVLGIKTGHTMSSGYNLVSAAENTDGLRLLAVVMGVKGDEMKVFRISKSLLEYGFRNYEYQVVEKAGEFKANVDILDAKDTMTIDLITTEGYKILLPKDKNQWNIEIKRTIHDNLKAPINKGSILGRLDYYRNGVLIKTINLSAANDVEKSNKAELREKLNEILRSKLLRNIIIIVLCILLFFGLLRLFFKRVVSGKRRKKNYYNHWR